MNLQKLKNYAYRTETNDGKVLGSSYKFIVGPGTPVELWCLTLETDSGMRKYQGGLFFPFYRGSDLNQMDKGDKVRVEVARIFGIPALVRVQKR